MPFTNPTHVSGTLATATAGSAISMTGPGLFDVSIGGTGTAFVVQVQRKRPSSSTWLPMQTPDGTTDISANTEFVGEVGAGVWDIRVECTNAPDANSITYEISARK